MYWRMIHEYTSGRANERYSRGVIQCLNWETYVSKSLCSRLIAPATPALWPNEALGPKTRERFMEG
ncbi:10913_t:CDS:2 [Acaulospora colombiana]|uniref:10913_t:CDS:1 n=1 Tax=Acaulospora colombiana TaxID=27376 RepID=A0ACA9MHM6_9GLOM|nr:10913_t:CDS:2 [Acaulospora colombiana]